MDIRRDVGSWEMPIIEELDNNPGDMDPRLEVEVDMRKCL